MKHVYYFLLVLCTALALGQTSLRAQVVISEFMAANVNGIDDEDGDEEDWIEIHNEGSSTVNLVGWHLTDDTNNLVKWQFPAVSLPPNGYLIVFASNKDRDVGELHTNFRLSDNGEYLALVEPDGITVAYDFFPAYPIQAPDVSYGLRGDTAQETLLAPGAPAKALIPTDASLEPSGQLPDELRPWTEEGLDDSSWLSGTTGIGYDYSGLVGLDVGAMQNVNQTVYTRIPFNVDDPSAITALTLRLRYEDGMIAYINGREVAWDNAPDPSVATWNSGSLGNRDDSVAVSPADFNITAFKDFLHVGSNLLAIQGLNQALGSSDLLILPEILATITGPTIVALRYFPDPTPGNPNNSGVAMLGPILDDDEFHPEHPTSSDPIVVSVRATEAFGPVASISLRYRVMFGNEVSLPMRDDGASGDQGMGDGIYGAIIPSSALGAGQMVRWYIAATDNAGNTSRSPAFADPENSPEYHGTVVHDPSLINPLPVLHWFIANPGAADNDAGTRCSLFWDGELYDNLNINLHGQSSRGFRKKSYDVDFHPGYNFNWREGEPRADDINLLTTFPDKAQMRNELAYGTFRDADNPYHFVIPVRVQQNGSFWGTAHIVENGDEDWLIRLGINSEGALYKMYNTFTSSGHATSGAEKKTRKSEPNNDLSAFYAGISQSGAAKRRYMYDNMDVGQIVNYLAANSITGNTDCCHKNYYFYRDSGQSDEWQMWPWDVDLSFGRRWIGSQTYWDDDMIIDTPLYVGGNNTVPQAIYEGGSETRQMYLRRVRTLMDELIKPAGTPPEQLHYENIIAELAAQIEPDATLDDARWDSLKWGNGSAGTCCPQTYDEAIADIVDLYLPARRLFLEGIAEIPDSQPPGTVVNFGTIEANPSNGNQDQEYIQLNNPNAFAVDISGWTLSGAVSFRFRGGTVIPSNGRLYVSPNRVAWRARTLSPRGNEANFVVGNYDGRLSARGELLQLTDRQGVIVASVNTPSVPSLAQAFLRITEIMYHPPVLPGDTADSQEYEYIELKNTGLATLSLSGVKFVEGITFDFTGSSVTSLSPGERVLVVKNTAAFAERYGAGFNIAGQYSDYLDNGGERVRLDDANNEKVLDFSYNNSWYPITDGRGFSLVIVEDTAPFQSWDLPESWRPSGTEYGSPGIDDTPLAEVPAILVNEALTHTDFPILDTIELFNPTASTVDLGGWYLTDDPGTPKKFQIPPGTSIPAGGYVTFDEDDFNSPPGVPPSFSLSSTGDEVYLYSGAPSGELTGYHQGYSFDAAENGIPFGRYIDTQGVEHFVALQEFTPGAVNSGPKVGPVVISEIMYHPLPLQEGIDLVENFIGEFIELQNISGAPVDLFDPANAANTWRLGGDVEFDFPSGATLAADGHALIVSFDPLNNPVARAAFEAQYSLAPGQTMFGPFRGSLNNAGGAIRLRRPDTPNLDVVPSILVDEVDYTDDTPWPVSADGTGPTLQRIVASEFGNDPANWTGAAPTPGAPFGGGNPPRITTHPQSQSIVRFSDVTFSVSVSGDAPFSYQWRKDGQSLLGETGETLTISNVQASDGGSYMVLVLNASGSVASSNAVLTVLIPAEITQQPQDTAVNAGGDAILVVSATSSTPITYRWYHDGQEILGVNDPFLSLTDVDLSAEGEYYVTLTDAVGTIVSDTVNLTVLLNPVINEQPQDLTVTRLSSPVGVTFSVTASSATPLVYQWYFNGVPMTPNARVASVTDATLTFTDVELGDTGEYTVVVSDDYGSITSQPAFLQVNTRAVVTIAPINREAPEGGMVAFSAAWEGSGPFLHRWRRTSSPAGTLGVLAPTQFGQLYITDGYITATPTNSVLVFTNISAALAGSYDVVVSNAVGQLATADGILTVVTDTDRDGLPNSWEDGRTGFDSNDPSDALRDDDGDGVNNTDEYFSGTDYLDPESYLKVELTAAGSAVISFQAVAELTYSVQYSDGVSPVDWRPLNIVAAEASTRTVMVIDTAARPERVYRLVTPAVPE